MRDATGPASAHGQSPRPWPDDGLEYDLGYALGRLQAATAPDRAVALLADPLYQVRQGAIAGLADAATGQLVAQVVAARDRFLRHPRYPSPFPYDAFTAIDRMLHRLEVQGTTEDVVILGRLRDNRPPPPKGETDWVRERLVWTIDERCLRLPEAEAPPALCADRRCDVLERLLARFGVDHEPSRDTGP